MSVLESTESLDYWQIGALIWMVKQLWDEDDPQHAVEIWFDEASEYDDEQLRWAMSAWEELRNMTSLDLEILLASLRRTPRG